MTPSKTLSTLALCAVAGWLLLGTGCSRASRKTSHLQSAANFLAAGDYPQAEIEFRNVLTIEPNDPTATIGLARAFQEQGRVARALPLMVRGRQLAQDDVDNRLRLAAILLASGRVNDARGETRFVLEKRPADAEGLLLIAQAASQPEDFTEARALIQAAARAGGSEATTRTAEAALCLREKRFDDAGRLLQEAIAADPKSSAAHAFLGALALARGAVAEAGPALQKAAELAPPRSPRRIQFAQFKIRTGDIEAAKQILDQVIREAPDFLPASVARAEIALVEKKPDECAALIGRVLARDPQFAEAQMMETRLQIAKGEFAKAEAALKKLVVAYPQSAPLQYYLAFALLAGPDSAAAEPALERALALAPDYTEAILLRAQIQIRKGEHGAAVVALRQLVQNQPKLEPARLLLIEAYQGQGNFAAALEACAQLRALAPKNPLGPLLTGGLLLQQGLRAEAREAFGQALSLQPGLALAHEKLVTLELQEKNLEGATTRAREFATNFPESAEAHLLVARVAMARHDRTEAENELKRVIALRPDAPAPYILLARVYLEAGRVDEALRNVEGVAVRNPRDVGALMLVGTLNQQRGNMDPARDAYEKLLAINPDFGAALNNLAYLYSEHYHQLDRAYEIADRARKIAPHDPYVLDTYGWILFQRKQFAWAKGLLTESASKLANEPEVQRHLGLTHYMLGEEEDARRLLEAALHAAPQDASAEDLRARLAVLDLDPRAPTAGQRQSLDARLKQQPDDPVALIRLAQIQEHSGNPTEARATYENAIRLHPKHARLLIALAQFKADRLNDLPGAYAQAQEALAASPDDLRVARTTGRLAFRAGEYNAALALLRNCVRRLPDDPEILSDLAETLYITGELEGATATMTRALEHAPTPERARAAKTFLELAAMAKSPPAERGAVDTVLSWIEANLISPPALMARAAIHEKAGDTTASAADYEQMLQRFPTFLPATLRLADLYGATSERAARALELAETARAARPNDPEVTRILGTALYLTGNYARAASLLAESAVRGTPSARTLFHLGMAQHRTNNAAARPTLERALALGLGGGDAAEARSALAAAR